MVTQEKIKCACGCGRIFNKYDNKKRVRKYVSGHNSRVFNPNKKCKVKQTCNTCNAIYFRNPSLANRGRNNYCSRHCLALAVGKQLKNDLLYKERQRQLVKKLGNKPPLITGKNHWNWKGGVSKYNRGKDYKYIQWRKEVLFKYNYTCQICKKRGGKLSSHHVVLWSKCKELRYEIKNGLCLCFTCHMKLHGLGKREVIELKEGIK